MSLQEPTKPVSEHTRAITKQDREERKQRLQTHGRSSVTQSIAECSCIEERRSIFCQRRLRIVRPVLPDFVRNLEVRGLRVGTGRADLRFERKDTGMIATTVLRVEGKLEVISPD